MSIKESIVEAVDGEQDEVGFADFLASFSCFSSLIRLFGFCIYALGGEDLVGVVNNGSQVEWSQEVHG